MNCEYGNARLDDYFDHVLSASAQAVFLAHCRQCPVCRAAVDEHTRYMVLLQTFKLSSPNAVPRPVKPRVDTETAAVHIVAGTRGSFPWFMRAAAAVATLALGLAWYSTREDAPLLAGAQSPGDIWSKVNIVIQVPATLDDAKLTVSLPQGIYIQGHADLQTLAWNTDFAEGTNALELPVRIDSAAFDRSMPQYLDATLEYQGVSKTFEFLVDLDEAVVGTF